MSQRLSLNVNGKVLEGQPISAKFEVDAPCTQELCSR
jgi:hypothetical protein